MCDACSMCGWYPLVRSLDIPQPKTVIVPIPLLTLRLLYAEVYDFSAIIAPIKDAVAGVGYPLFLRTDHTSGKHGWRKTCYVHIENELWQHLVEVVEANLMADIMGLPFKAFVFRQFIPMASQFLAFYGRLPINPERRYFIDGNKLVCHHPYWVEDAIRVCPETPSAWKQLLRKMNKESPKEVSILTRYCVQVGAAVQGFWSVDFCKGQDGVWYLIDMAKGECSWHPGSCPGYRRR